MFKERSYDLCPDFILNFGQVIRKKAWDTENFESALMNIDLLKYYILALDDKCTYGIPICFTFIDGHFYAYLNYEPKYFKIKKMQSILKDITNMDKIKTTNIMDWNHKYRFIFNNGKEIMLNQILFNMKNVISYDLSNLKFDTFIIDSRFVGTYVILIDGDRLYPIYILNQNYIRFNHCIVNTDQILTFLQLQQFRNNNFIYKNTDWKKNNIELFLEYDFLLHHIHNDKLKGKQERKETETKETQDNKEKNEKEKKNERNEKKEEKKINTIPEDAKGIVEEAIQDLKNKKNKKDNMEAKESDKKDEKSEDEDELDKKMKDLTNELAQLDPAIIQK